MAAEHESDTETAEAWLHNAATNAQQHIESLHEEARNALAQLLGDAA